MTENFPASEKRNRPFRRWALRLLGASAALLAWFGIYYLMALSAVASLEKENPDTTTFIEWKRAVLRAKGKPDKIDRRFVPYRQISPHLREAVRKSEDFAFFEHGGFDFDEMKASWRDSREKGKKLRGASTITMQTARLLYLSPDRDLLRKFREAVITVALERKLKKERIFELYLNYADWGNGVFGAEAATRRYLGKSCRDLSCREAVALAAMLPNPDDRHPSRPTRAMAAHMKRLARKMSCAAAESPTPPHEEDSGEKREAEEETEEEGTEEEE